MTVIVLIKTSEFKYGNKDGEEKTDLQKAA